MNHATEFDIENMFEYANSLYNDFDYYRTISEIEYILYFYPLENQTHKFLLPLFSSYLQLKEHSKIQKLKTKWETTESFEDINLYRQTGTLLAFSFLQENKQEESLEVWQKTFPKSENHFPTSENIEGLIDPKQARLYSSIIPGSGFLLSKKYAYAFTSFLINTLFLFGIYHHAQKKNYGIAGTLLFFEISWYGGGKIASEEYAIKYNKKLIDARRKKWMLENLK